MKIDGKNYRTIWPDPNEPMTIKIIDQTALPFRFEIIDLTTPKDAEIAIETMQVRGAGLIGATAAFGMYLASLHADYDNFNHYLQTAADRLMQTRPTAVNLQWAVNQQLEVIKNCQTKEACIQATFEKAMKIADDDAMMCRKIGENGLGLIREIESSKNGETINILTHCNAGWLAFVDYGSATAPIYMAHDAGIDVHVWVDETRPRNQGARLTSWELLQHGVPYTVIPDNTGGHLMQHGLVDMVITGADRVTRAGDVANKIGTYLKALAARDNGLPFYVALPSSTFDWDISDGVAEIPIEQRNGKEVKYMSGLDGQREAEVLIMPEDSLVANYGFDVTPSRLIDGLITERGVCKASEEGIKKLFD
jgi:methylthioribose-1-phosphate isomerase